MTDRIIDISDFPARLSIRNRQLVIDRKQGGTGVSPVMNHGQDAHATTLTATVPIEDLAVLVVANMQVSYTHPVLAGIAEAGAVMVVCGENHLPVGMLAPLAGHTTQTERIAAQIGIGEPKRKRLWQAIVRRKIEMQGSVARELRGNDGGLRAMAARVRSGDPSNVEAQAARRYWPLLIADPEFRRRPEGPPPNDLLNYGYAVLRAAVARAVCAAGLHPSIGLHHKNRYDAFCLADDLMEPFRPLVDRAVAGIVQEHGRDASLADREVKRALLSALTGQVEVDGERRTLFDAAGRLAASLARNFSGQQTGLVLPIR
jgi:CRISPR-associated protein Cas1